jgi:hypothetical protein
VLQLANHHGGRNLKLLIYAINNELNENKPLEKVTVRDAEESIHFRLKWNYKTMQQIER